MSSRVARRIRTLLTRRRRNPLLWRSVVLTCCDLLICHLLIFMYVCVSKRRDRDSRRRIKGVAPVRLVGLDGLGRAGWGVGHSHGLELLGTTRRPMRICLHIAIG